MMFEGVFEAALTGGLIAAVGGGLVGGILGLVEILRRGREGWLEARKALEVTSASMFRRIRHHWRWVAAGLGAIAALVALPVLTETSVLIRQSKAGLANERTACLYFAGARLERRYFGGALITWHQNDLETLSPECPLLVKGDRAYSWLSEPEFYSDAELPYINALLAGDRFKLEEARRVGYSEREIFQFLANRRRGESASESR